MHNSITFKPVIWRLLVYRFFPFYIGWTGTDIVYKLNKHYLITPFSLLLSALTILIGVLIGVLFTYKKFEILIDANNLSGISIGWGLSRETFPIANLDFSYRDKQTFYEKISFFRTIRSLNGQKIMVVDFIYGKPVSDEIYRIVEQYHLQSSAS